MMTTDRELLELAAKAAGIQINVARTRERDDAGFGSVGLWTTTQTNWNPLTDDGDALRLAAKMGMQISIDQRKWCSTAFLDEGTTVPCEWFDSGQQTPDEATRRAIVRAAANICRAMP